MSIVLQVRPEELQNGLDIKDPATQSSICSRLIKADFSGAKVKIVKSKDGKDVEGIIVRETARTFTVINSEDQVKVVLNANDFFRTFFIRMST